MIIAKLEKKQAASDGKPFLSGRLNQDVRLGTLVILKKSQREDDTYELIELGPRKINTDPLTLLTWMD